MFFWDLFCSTISLSLSLSLPLPLSLSLSLSLSHHHTHTHLQLYGVGHMVKNHSDNKETCCWHMGSSFWSAAKLLYMHHPTDRIAHTTAFVTPVVEHWLEWEISQMVHHEGLVRWPTAPWTDTLPWSYILLPWYIIICPHISLMTDRSNDPSHHNQTLYNGELHLTPTGYYNLSTYIINLTNCLHSPSVFISSARLDSKPVKSLANMVRRHSTMESYILLPQDITILLMWLTASTHPVCSLTRPDLTRSR